MADPDLKFGHGVDILTWLAPDLKLCDTEDRE